VHDEDYKALEQSVKQIINKNYAFEKLLVSKEQALDLFSYNKFKLELIEKKCGPVASVFKVGDFVDLCTGPHVLSTKYI
jgi:threonyl-tRNA synthetase